mgnify:CR=1 FL=1
MEKPVSVRAQVRKTVFALAAVAVLAGAAGKSAAQVQRLTVQQAAQDEGRLGELGASLEQIAQTLTKTRYAGTPGMAHELAAKALAESAAAKVHLTQLTCAGSCLDEVNRFLSQAGNYALSLARRRAAGEHLTQEDSNALEELAAYARSLADTVSRLEQDVAGGMTLKTAALPYPEEDGEKDGPFAQTAAISPYPALIYDGAYSDGLLSADAPAFSKGISEEDALLIAQSLTGRAFSGSSESGGPVPCWIFYDGECGAAIAKQGGGVVSVSYERAVGEAAVGFSEAEACARRFLERAGFSSMVMTGAQAAGGEQIFFFVYEQDGVLCLPDEVCVGVALDTGEAVWLDAAAYWKNHRQRTLEEPALTAEEGLASLGDQVRGAAFSARVRMTTAGGLEADCYEYRARGADGEGLLLYVDTQTGEEREILFSD